MRDNRPFTEQEDKLIKDLFEEQNIKNWSMVARKLTEDHKFARNAKQCRDRYQQHLDPMMVSQWTEEEEQKLYGLHNEIGNKWAVIAQKFPGRTDNCVKNHFYSKLRKSLRHLNKVIKQNYKRQFKELKIAAIYKIIEALQDRFNEATLIEQEAFNQCMRLKKQLLVYSNRENRDSESTEDDFQKQKELIQDIIDFSKTYKRKTKKQRRNSLNGAELFKPATFEKRIKYFSDHEESDSQYSFVVSHKENTENESDESQIKLGVIQQDLRDSLNSKYEPSLRFTQKIQPHDNEVRSSLKISYKSNKSYHNFHSVEQILKQKNILEQGCFINRLEASICSLSLHSDSQKQDMFDDNLRISEGLRNIEEMEEQSPEESIFRSQR